MCSYSRLSHLYKRTYGVRKEKTATQKAFGLVNDLQFLIYISMIQLNSIASTDFAIHLQGYSSGDVDLFLVNQLTGSRTSTTLTPTSTNGRSTQFSYQPTGLLEGMYLIQFKDAIKLTTLAERLCYIRDGKALSESSYTAYTTGDSDQDYVYTP